MAASEVKISANVLKDADARRTDHRDFRTARREQLLAPRGESQGRAAPGACGEGDGERGGAAEAQSVLPVLPRPGIDLSRAEDLPHQTRRLSRAAGHLPRAGREGRARVHLRSGIRLVENTTRRAASTS